MRCMQRGCSQDCSAKGPPNPAILPLAKPAAGNGRTRVSPSSRGGEREVPGGAEAVGRGPGGRGAGPEGAALPSPPPSPRLLANGRVRVSPLPASVVSGGTIAFRAWGGSRARLPALTSVRRRSDERRSQPLSGIRGRSAAAEVAVRRGEPLGAGGSAHLSRATPASRSGMVRPAARALLARFGGTAGEGTGGPGPRGSAWRAAGGARRRRDAPCGRPAPCRRTRKS